MTSEENKLVLTPIKLVLVFAGLFALTVVSHFTAARAEAATLNWTGATDANWSTAANWSTSTAPINGDSVTFAAGPTTVATNNNISSLTLNTVTFSGTSQAYHISGNPLSISGNLTVNGSVTAAIQIDAPLSGPGSIVMNGATTGLLTLTVNNSGLSGPVSLNAGSISAASGALGSGTLTLAGGTLQGNGSSATLSNPISVSSASSLGGSVNLTLTGVISGTAGLTQNGSITLTLGGSNTFNGFTNTSGTTIVSTNASALGSGTATFGAGTVLQAGSALTLSNPFTFTSNPTISGTFNLTLSGPVIAASGFTKSGASTLTLSGTNPSLAGTLSVNGNGTLAFSSSPSLGSANINLNIGALQPTTTGLAWNNAITLGGPALINVVGVNSSTANGAISGSGALTVNGSGGALTLGAVESYSGGTTINGAGTSIALSSTGSLPPTGTFTILGGTCLCLSGATSAQTIGSILGSGTLNLPPSGLTLGDNSSGAFIGAIGGTGASLTKVGAGKLTLAGTQTYTGNTAVNGGALLVNTTLSSSAVTVGSGGLLSGGGVLGTVTVNNGGALSPALGAGNLTVNTVTFMPGAFFFTGIGGPNVDTADNGFEQLTVTGTANLNGATLTVGLLNGFSPTTGQAFTVINGPVNGAFNGIAQGGTVTVSGITFTVAYGSVVLTAQGGTAVATATPTATPTPASGGGGSTPPSTSGQTVSNSSTVSQSAQQALATAGLSNVVIPAVPAPGVAAAPADVPVPLAPLNAGALVLPLNAALTSQVLAQLASAPAPVAVSAAVNTAQGGVIVGGNVILVLTSAAFNLPALQPGQTAPGAQVIQVSFQPLPSGVTIPGGPAQFSPNGTVLDIKFTDQTTGLPITTFAAPIQLTLNPNAADISQSGGHPETLTAAYVIDAQSPALENPLGFPIGTFVIFPPSGVVNNGQTVTVLTQALGSTIAVVTNPVGYVQSVTDNAPVLSSFDPATAQTFGTKAPFSYLQVVEPQIGSRLLVLDPDTGNYGYVNATDVGPSGPPPPKTSSAVVRGLAGPSPKPPSGAPPAPARR